MAEKAKNAAAVSKARAHASELEAAVASSDAEAADGAFKKAKQGVSDKLVALRSALLLQLCKMFRAIPALPILDCHAPHTTGKDLSCFTRAQF